LSGHILRRNFFLHDAIEGQMTEMKGVGRRRTKLLEDLRNRKGYWGLKDKAECKKRCKRQFINSTQDREKHLLTNKLHT